MSSKDESAFLGSIQPSDGIAPRQENPKQEERADKEKEMIAALIPATDLFGEIIENEIKRSRDIHTYLTDTAPTVNSATRGEDIYVEFRARQLYNGYLKKLKQLLDKAAKTTGVSDE